MYAFTFSCSAAIVVMAILLVVLRKNLSVLLRDESTQTVMTDRTFSLSKTLFFFWTLVVVLSICYIGIVSDNLPDLDSGVLILMGIIAGTTTAAKTIDYTQIQNPNITSRPQNCVSEGFWRDILSDDNGLSVSRLQTVLFTIIYSFAFMAIVITQNVLYNFPPATLTLLGISSGAYALLKIPESK